MPMSRGGFPARKNFSKPYKPYGKYKGNVNSLFYYCKSALSLFSWPAIVLFY